MILGTAEGFVQIDPQVEAAIGIFLTEQEILLEAGGILIGNYRGPHVVVGTCTTPLPGDCRRNNLFDRRDAGHQAAALGAWERSEGTDTFVGEWHTHPVDHPNPSELDLRTWHDLLRRTSASLVFLIVGRRSLLCGIGHDGCVRRLTTCWSCT